MKYNQTVWNHETSLITLPTATEVNNLCYNELTRVVDSQMTLYSNDFMHFMQFPATPSSLGVPGSKLFSISYFRWGWYLLYHSVCVQKHLLVIHRGASYLTKTTSTVINSILNLGHGWKQWMLKNSTVDIKGNESCRGDLRHQGHKPRRRFKDRNCGN